MNNLARFVLPMFILFATFFFCSSVMAQESVVVEISIENPQHHYAKVALNYKKVNIEANVTEFIEDMAEAYEWADLVICRAGALTVSELANAGVAAILVPYPYAVDDHQTANAKYLVSAGAAIAIQQDQLALTLKDVLSDILKTGRSRLLEMAKAARELAKPGATQIVAETCLGVSHG